MIFNEHSQLLIQNSLFVKNERDSDIAVVSKGRGCKYHIAVVLEETLFEFMAAISFDNGEILILVTPCYGTMEQYIAGTTCCSLLE